MIIQNLDKVKVDFTVVVASNKTTEITNKIKTETSQFEEVSGVYPAFRLDKYNILFAKGNGTEDWSYINQTGSFNDFLNQTFFLGIERDYLMHPNLQGATIFYDSNYSTTENGIYVNKRLADKFGLVKEDTLTIRTFSFGESKNITNQIGSFKILGIFDVTSRSVFSQVYSGGWSAGYFGINDYLVLAGFNFTYSLFKNTEQDPNGFYDMNTVYGVLLDHWKMPIFDTQKLQERVNQINNRLKQVIRGEQMSFVNSQLQDAISTINSIVTLINNILIMISIPVLLLTWFLIKTNYHLSFTERNREIGLLKSKGATESQIRAILNLESFSIGLIGSVLGLFFGSLASGIISKYVYDFEGEINPLQQIVSAFTSAEVIFPWIALGVVFSYISSKKPIKDFVQRNPSELLGYYEPSHSELEKKKSDILIMILGVFPIVYPLITLLLQQSMYFFFISLFLSAINVVLLILGPFLLVYAIVKFLCVRSIGGFTKIIHAITSKFDKNRAFFIQKSIISNQARAAKIIFIIGMFTSFLVMNTTVIASEQKYQERSAFLSDAGGIPFYISSPTLSLNGNYSKYSDYLIKSSNLSIQHVIPFIYDYSLRIQVSYEEYNTVEVMRKPFIMCKIDPNATLQAASIPDDYFIGMTFQEAMNKLISIPNSTLIPIDYANTEGLKIGDTLNFQYEGNSSESRSIDIQIVGFYKYYPIVSISNYQAYGLIHVNTANDTKFNLRSHALVAYPDESVKDSLKFSHIRASLEDFDSSAFIYSIIYDDSDGDAMFSINPEIIFDAIINFIMVEKIFLVLIVSFGLAIVMFASINEKSRQFALLRARGVPSKVMYQIQLSEGAVFIIIGIIIGLSGILSAYSFILQINNLTVLFSAMERTLYIPWFQIVIEFGLSLVMFILIILWSVKVGLRKSDVDKISEVFRLA